MRNLFLSLVGIIIPVGFLLILPVPVFADMIIPGAANNIQLSTTLTFNFLANLTAIFLICKYYLAYRHLIKIIIASFFVTISGGIIDLVSMVIISQIFYYFDHQSSIVTVLFYLSFLVLSFILLWTMYYFMIRKIFKVKFQKKTFLAAGILALVTNPVWYLILVACINYPPAKFY